MGGPPLRTISMVPTVLSKEELTLKVSSSPHVDFKILISLVGTQILIYFYPLTGQEKDNF